MNTDKLNRWLSLGANLGVIAGLIFVALEIQTNTESNRIATEQSYSDNWMLINESLASNPNLSEIFEKALAGEALNRTEARQFRHLASMYLTQAFYMLSLYDAGVVTEQEVRDAFRALREYAQRGEFREHVETISNERRRRLILDPDGLDEWLDAESQ